MLNGSGLLILARSRYRNVQIKDQVLDGVRQNLAQNKGGRSLTAKEDAGVVPIQPKAEDESVAERPTHVDEPQPEFLQMMADAHFNAQALVIYGK